MTGRYRLTKFEWVYYNTGGAQDMSSTLLGCELSGIYTLKPDSTASYTESTGCTGSGSGTWSLSSVILLTAFTFGDGNRINLTYVQSWDCSILVVMTAFPSVEYNYRFTLTRF